MSPLEFSVQHPRARHFCQASTQFIPPVQLQKGSHHFRQEAITGYCKKLLATREASVRKGRKILHTTHQTKEQHQKLVADKGRKDNEISIIWPCYYMAEQDTSLLGRINFLPQSGMDPIRKGMPSEPRGYIYTTDAESGVG